MFKCLVSGIVSAAAAAGRFFNVQRKPLSVLLLVELHELMILKLHFGSRSESKDKLTVDLVLGYSQLNEVNGVHWQSCAFFHMKFQSDCKIF